MMGKRKRSGSFSRNDNDSKKSDDCDSQEEMDLDGSALLRGLGSNATRCSARVQEKQEKLRREASPSKQIVAPVEATAAVASVPVPGPSAVAVTGVVVNKGSNKVFGPVVEEVQVPCQSPVELPTTSLSINVGLEEKRKKRNWELWSIEDKQLFFEALNEYGKDFDAIQSYLATKLKPRNKTVGCSQYAPKNKDQVRHFYYRTWNKISKYLHFPSDMKKANQELYGLVNYGELRKKQRVLNSKSAVKLSELIENGMTAIKYRGKTCRIKTPVCRALKRLNGLEDIEHTRVPPKVILELIPADGNTWRCIQGMSHNPRTKVYVSLQRTLASVIQYFEDRWKSNEDRLKEQLSSLLGRPRPKLRVIPSDRRDSGVPIFKVAENTSSTTICLRSYTENVLFRGNKSEEMDMSTGKFKRSRKQSGSASLNLDPNDNMLPLYQNKRLSFVDPNAADAENSDAESHFPMQCSSSFSRYKHGSDYEAFGEENTNAAAWIRFQQKCYDEDDDLDTGIGELNSGVFGDGLNASTETDNDDLDQDDGKDLLCPCGSGKPTESEMFVSHVWDDERVKTGWTAEEAGVLTIGELYFMFGQTDKLCFEYRWDPTNDAQNLADTRSMLTKLIATARVLKKKKTSKIKAAHTSGSTVGVKHVTQLCSNCGFQVETPSSVLTISPKENPGVGSPGSLLCQQQQARSNWNALHTTVSPTGELPPTEVAAASSTSTSVIALTSDTLRNGSVATDCSDATNLNHDTSDSFESSDNIVTLHAVNSNDGSETEVTLIGLNSKKSALQAVETEQNTENQQPLLEESLPVSISTTDTPSHTSCPSGVLIDSALLSSEPCLEMPEDTQKLTSDCKPNVVVVAVNTSTVPSSSCNKLDLLDPVITSDAKPASDTSGQSSETLKPISDNCMAESSYIHVTKQAAVGSPLETNHMESTLNEQTSFRRPTVAIKPKDDLSSQSGENSQALPPKPFLDLPKGNRRLGRRPNYKRVVVPRVLPLLPKQDDSMIAHSSFQSTTTILTVNAPASTSGLSKSSAIPSGVLIPVTSISVITSDNGTILPSSLSNRMESALPGATADTGSDAQESCPVSLKEDEGISASQVKSHLKDLHDGFLGTNPSSISCNSTDFEDLLKVRRQDRDSSIPAGDMDGLSLSSFMEISLPESTRIVANECISADMQLEDLENSNCSLSLSNILSSVPKPLLKDLSTPESSPKKQTPFQTMVSGSDAPVLTNLGTYDTPWTLEAGEMSLSSIFGNYETPRETTGLSESDMNFQFSEGSLDFVSKLTELSSSSTERK